MSVESTASKTDDFLDDRSGSSAEACQQVLGRRRRRGSSEPCPLVDYEDLKDMQYLASGNFAEVYKAKLHGQMVAVKIAQSPERENVCQLLSEQQILAEVFHLNCINILGAGNTSEDKPRPFIVLEYLAGGDLKAYLSEEMRRQKKSFWPKKKEQLLAVGSRFQQRLDLCIQLARALEYLHQNCLAAKGKALLHRDLKPANILLTPGGRLVLADFGIAKTQDTSDLGLDDSFTMTGETGSLRYMAPENARCEAYGTAVDTYSFGVLAWQILALKVPFQGVSTDTFMDRVINGNERPAIEEEQWPLALEQLLQRCWAPHPGDRPPMDQVKVELERVKDELLSTINTSSSRRGWRTRSSTAIPTRKCPSPIILVP